MSSQVRTCFLCSLYCVFIDYMPEPAAFPLGVSHHAWDHRWWKCTKIFYLSRPSLFPQSISLRNRENISPAREFCCETRKNAMKRFKVMVCVFVHQLWMIIVNTASINDELLYNHQLTYKKSKASFLKNVANDTYSFFIYIFRVCFNILKA